MKNLFILFILVLSHVSGHAQFGPQQIISTDADRARQVIAADMDGDGDMDAISSSQTDDKVAWYENLDGLGNFGPQIVIETLDQLMFLDVGDLDNDGDNDVVVSVVFSDQLLWFENDGSGMVWTQHVISAEFERYELPVIADMDGDGDLDVTVATDFDDTIRWFENADGNGTFSVVHFVSNQGNNGRGLAVDDLDGDGDMDIVAESSGTEILSWYRNMDGQGNFSGPIIIDFNGLAVTYIALADYDQDTDIDIATVVLAEDKIMWYENLNGLGTYGSERLISEGTGGVFSIYACDLDNDGDMDLASGSGNTSPNVAWYENDGLGNFGALNIISTEIAQNSAIIVFAADVDNDGDIDLLSSSSADDKIAWYENLTILGNEEFEKDMFTVYPNPVGDLLTIDSKDPIVKVTFYDVLGRRLQEVEENFQEISVAILSQGFLFVEITTEKGKVVKKLLKQ